MRARLVLLHRIRGTGLVVALLAAWVLALGGAATSSAKPDAPGSPDTYVAYWDGVGSHAFTAAGLSPAESHVIFAYVALSEIAAAEATVSMI